jgi:hypothetical protein
MRRIAFPVLSLAAVAAGCAGRGMPSLVPLSDPARIGFTRFDSKENRAATALPAFAAGD